MARGAARTPVLVFPDSKAAAGFNQKSNGLCTKIRKAGGDCSLFIVQC
jgi:hypothetical protein